MYEEKPFQVCVCGYDSSGDWECCIKGQEDVCEIVVETELVFYQEEGAGG